MSTPPTRLEGYPTLVVGPGQVSITDIPGRPGCVYFFNWNVPPEQRGQGRGHDVLVVMCWLADEQGVTVYTHPDTPRLGAVFAKMGFTEVGDPARDWDGKPLMVRYPRRVD